MIRNVLLVLILALYHEVVLNTTMNAICSRNRYIFGKAKTPAKRKDPPVSRRQVFLRSEHFRSALDPIRLYRSNVINAVWHILLYAGRTGRQLCFAATQQKEVSPADAGKTPNWLSLIFEVETIPFLIHRHEAIAGLTFAVTEIGF